MTTFTTTSVIERGVCGDNETDKEQIDEIEDTNTPHNLLRGFRDFFDRIVRLGSGESGKFTSTECE